MRETRSTCPYCGVGCGVIIESDGDRITGVRGDPAHPANAGRLCTKGSTLHLTAAAPVQMQTRLLRPLRRERRDQALAPVSWDEALDTVAEGLVRVAGQHGPDAVGLYISGQLLTEDYYVFNKLAKGLLGTNNVDTNSRLCMSSAVAGYKASLGADSVPACYEDLDHAATIFIAGSNAAWAHPVLFRRLEDARAANPALKLVVADPRRTETAAVADLHLPLLPGTDVALFHAMLHVMVWEGLVDEAYIEAHTTGWPELRQRLRDYTPEHAARICGLQADAIVQAARWFANVDEGGLRQPTLSLYCQGLNQSASGTDKNSCLINLHLASGQIGRPGAGPLSLTGQPNAMGGREVGGLANLLSAHRDLANPAHREEVAALWDVAEVPSKPGRTAVELFQAAADGEVRALWIASTNPAASMPDQRMVQRALERAELVIVQDAYAGVATLRHADIVLPAAAWGEKDGSVTNSERRISRVLPAVAPPGEARADWRIAVDVARRIEQRRPPARRRGGRSMFGYESAEAVWCEHRESTRGRDLDITGLDYRLLEQAPRQWPCPQGQTEGRARLYEDGRFATADGRARFLAPPWRAVAEPRDARYPVSLNTGRLRDQWHTMSRTGTLGRLFTHSPEPALEMHPQELERRGWRAGDLVRARSRRAGLVLPVQPSEAVAPAQAFIAMHWGPEYLRGGVNLLTTGARCPQSNQPELKHAAIRVESAALSWQLVGAAWLDAGQVLVRREALRALFDRFEFASCVPIGREPDGPLGVLFRAAAATPVDDAQLTGIEHLLGLDLRSVLHYEDRRNGQRRAVRLGDDGTLQAFLLAGNTAAADWMLPMLQQRGHAAPLGRQMLAASRSPPGRPAPARRQVCSCLNVAEDSMVELLGRTEGTPEHRLAALQSALRCGTQCGSCLPAIRVLVREHPATATA